MILKLLGLLDTFPFNFSQNLLFFLLISLLVLFNVRWNLTSWHLQNKVSFLIESSLLFFQSELFLLLFESIGEFLKERPCFRNLSDSQIFFSLLYCPLFFRILNFLKQFFLSLPLFLLFLQPVLLFFSLAFLIFSRLSLRLSLRLLIMKSFAFKSIHFHFSNKFSTFLLLLLRVMSWSFNFFSLLYRISLLNLLGHRESRIGSILLGRNLGHHLNEFEFRRKTHFPQQGVNRWTISFTSRNFATFFIDHLIKLLHLLFMVLPFKVITCF